MKKRLIGGAAGLGLGVSLLAAYNPAAAPEDVAKAGAVEAAAMSAASTVLLSPSDDAALALQVNRLVWRAASVAIGVDPRDVAGVATARAAAREVGAPIVPVRLTGADSRLSAASGPAASELRRLGTSHLLVVGRLAQQDPQMPRIRIVKRAMDLPPAAAVPAPGGKRVLLWSPRVTVKPALALASGRAAGARTVRSAYRDPRIAAASVRKLGRIDPDQVIALGSRFGNPDRLASRLRTATTGVQLPGGGQVIFNTKRYVALYGHPGVPALGVLGEQGVEATVARAKSVAAQYEPHSKQQVIPSFEIITTVATAGAGPDGNYSNEVPASYFRPMIEAARRAGVYVILDLQPGRSTFLSQAKLYRSLLREPHVGLALDPEWRLKPGQQHLEQIGSVDVREINDVSAWLADFVGKNRLPQKMLLLHQFRTDMIPNRQDLRARSDDVAIVIQMDGFGSPAAKYGTWNALRKNTPRGVVWGWKNFYDEDSPTFSPRRTFTEVRPKPWWVSYQ